MVLFIPANNSNFANRSFLDYLKGNKPVKIKNNEEDKVVVEDAKPQSDAGHAKYKAGNKGPEKIERLKDDLGESAEQIDELSKKTLGSYVKKAVGSHAGNIANAAVTGYSGKKVDSDTNRWIKNRTTGINRAVNKMANEEVDQIDELSKSTLGSYATKALNRADIAARMSHSDSDEMGKIAAKRTAGVKKAVDKIAPKKADATRIKTNVDKAGVAAKHRYTDKDDQGKAYYAAQKGISKIREEAEQIDEISQATKDRYIQKAQDSHSYAAAHRREAQSTGDKKTEGDMTRMMKKRNQGMSRAFGESAEQIDELSKKTLGSYIKKASVNAVNKAKESEKHYAATEHEDDVDTHNYHVVKSSKAADKASNRLAGIRRATNRLTKEDLDEAFKVGSMKLHDGSSVTLTRESADVLNGLFNQLNSGNKSKMEERLMSSSKGFSEILSFAKEAI